MQKFSVFTLMYVMIFFNFSATSQSKNPNIPSLTSYSQDILHLFYISQHLETPIFFIQQISHKQKNREQYALQHVDFFFSKTDLLKSEEINHVLKTLQKTHSLDCFFEVWKKVKHFKYGINLDEKIILLDFSKLCLVLYLSLITVMDKKHTLTNHMTPEKLAVLTIEKTIEIMETWSLFYFDSIPPLDNSNPQNLLYFNEFPASFAIRYYLNRRLTQTFDLLTSLHEKKTELFQNDIEFLGLQREEIIFDDPVIFGHFELLQKEKKLDPLIQLVRRFQSFNFIKNATFVKEFLVLLCIVYKDLFPTHTITQRSTETINEMHQLTVEELLSITDSINEKYFALYSPSPKQKNKLSHKQSDFFVTEAKPNPDELFFYTIPNKTKPDRHHHFKRIPDLIQHEYGVSPTVFSNVVFHRCYYVKRLEKAATIILKITNPQKKSASKTSMLLKPFSMAWEDFKSYRDICNKKLVDDFITEIVVISQNILNQSSGQRYLEKIQLFSTKYNTIKLLKKSLFREKKTIMSDFKSCIEINKVISRFYLMKRLDLAIAKLHTLNFKSILYFDAPITKTEIDFLLQELSINNKTLSNTILSIYTTQSFKPLIDTYDALTHYKLIEDDSINNELARFITYLFQSMIINHSTITCKNSFLNKKIHINLAQLQEMPLEDVLNLLDILVDQLPDFLEKTELNSNLEWKEWLKKYWLIAPISTVVLGLKIYLAHRGAIPSGNHSQRDLLITTELIDPTVSEIVS